MHSSPVRSARTRIAIGISIAVHLCGLALLSVLLGQPPYSSTIGNEVRPYRVTTIVRRPLTHMRAVVTRRAVVALATPPTAAPPRAQPARIQRPAQPMFHEPHAANPRTIHAPAVRPSALRPPGARGIHPIAHGLLAVAPAEPSPAVSPTVVPTATPTAAPTPERSPTSAPSPPPNTFGGLFSQNYPPALPAPAIVEAIRARLGGHGRVRVDVDESGHATDVHFAGPVDDDVARDVRAQLLGVTYVPADCNGLHCDGTLEIIY